MNDSIEDNFTAADDVNRAKAIITTCWLALCSNEFSDAGADEAGTVADTLFEAIGRLQRAERKMGVYHE